MFLKCVYLDTLPCNAITSAYLRCVVHLTTAISPMWFCKTVLIGEIERPSDVLAPMCLTL